ASRRAPGKEALSEPVAAGRVAAAPVGPGPGFEPGPLPSMPASEAPAPTPEPEPLGEREAEPLAEAPAEGDVDFAIDPVLFEILKPEVAGHLETVDTWLASCEAGPQPLSDPLLRAVHTMNGAFAMTEVSVLTEVTAPLEGFLK